MPNSLGSSCTADVQAIDWKMSLAGFVFLFFPLSYCFHSSGCGGTWLPLRWAFLGLLVQFSFPAGRSQVSSRECGWGKAVRSPQQSSCSSCWQLAGEVKPGPCRGTPSMGNSSGLCLERGNPGEGRNACLKRKLLVRVCMFKPSSVST